MNKGLLEIIECHDGLQVLDYCRFQIEIKPTFLFELYLLLIGKFFGLYAVFESDSFNIRLIYIPEKVSLKRMFNFPSTLRENISKIIEYKIIFSK